MLKIAYSPIYKYQLPDGHRFPMEKYELIPEQLTYEGTVTQDHFFEPDPLTREEILLTHDVSFLDKLESLTLSRKEVRDIGFPVSRELITRGKHISKGTYLCCKYAMEHGVSMNIAGGTHHAYADRGEGFCVFNDFAIASNMLRAESLVDRILIVDLDVHQGNGTAHIFAGNDAVFTFSMHGAKNYPLRKEKSDLDIGLSDGTQDDEYLHTLANHLPTILQNHEPELVLYLAGVDVLASDKLGRLSLSIAGCKARDEYVFNLCKDHDLPVAVSMGGGYSPALTTIVDAHANTFRSAQDIFF